MTLFETPQIHRPPVCGFIAWAIRGSICSAAVLSITIAMELACVRQMRQWECWQQERKSASKLAKNVQVHLKMYEQQYHIYVIAPFVLPYHQDSHLKNLESNDC